MQWKRIIGAMLLVSIALIPFNLSASTTISVSGVVIGLDEGFEDEPPVEGVLVRFVGTDIEDTTNADGEFTLTGVPARSASFLQLSKEGHITGYYRIETWDYDDDGLDHMIFREEIRDFFHGGDAPEHVPGKGTVIGDVWNEEDDEELADVSVQAVYADTGEPAGTLMYVDDDFLPDAALLATSENGTFFLYNVEPYRSVVVTGTKAGAVISSRVTATFPDALTSMYILEVADTAEVEGGIFTQDAVVEGAGVSLAGTGINDESGPDGRYMLQGASFNSEFLLKSVRAGYVDFYSPLRIDEDDRSFNFFMFGEDMFDVIQDELEYEQQAGRGLILLFTGIHDVEIRVYGEDGVLLPLPGIFYMGEEAPPDPSLDATEPGGGCIVMDLDPGLYYLTAHRAGFEFPLLMVPVFADAVTFIPALHTNTDVGRLEKFGYHGGQPPNAAVLNNAQDVPVFRFELWAQADRENVLLENVTFTAKGTGDISAALTDARLYYDSSGDGAFDALAATADTFAGGGVTFTGINTVIGAGFNNNWEVRYNFNGTAGEGQTFGLDLLKNRDVVSTGVHTGLGVTCSGYEIEGGFMTITAPGTPAAPVNLLPGDGAGDIPVSGYTLQTSAFSPGEGAPYPGSDVHHATRWQLREEGSAYDEALIDDLSGAPFLTIFSPPYDLEAGTTYYWRARHINGAGILSDWSGETRFTTEASADEFGGGDGTEENPYIILTPQHLDNVRGYPDAYFELGQDIDLGEAPYSAGAGWEPIPGFAGRLDGRGFIVKNLFIDRPDAGYACGLFGSLTEGGVLADIVLENVQVTGQSLVGGLAGYSEGLIKACRIIGGEVRGIKDDSDPEAEYSGLDVGGMVGKTGFGSVMEDCTVEGVEVFGARLVGGLAGWCEGGLISRCSVIGGIIIGEEDVGGLLGTLDKGGIVEYSSSGADVFGIMQASFIGGLIGVTYRFEDDKPICRVTHSNASGNVTGSRFVGGLVGNNADLTEIRYCYASGSVTGQKFVGGLAGGNMEDASIEDSYASGNVEIIVGGNYAGGLVGFNGAVLREGEDEIFPAGIKNCYAVGQVTGHGGYMGGLIGSQRLVFDPDEYSLSEYHEDIGTVESSFWNTDIKSAGIGSGESAGATGKTTGEMRKAETFIAAGWDFTGTWFIEEDRTYPYFLRDALPRGDISGDGEVNISDVILGLRMAVGLPVTVEGETYSEEDEPAGYPDWLVRRAKLTDGDTVTISDVILVLRIAIGLD